MVAAAPLVFVIGCGAGAPHSANTDGPLVRSLSEGRPPRRWLPRLSVSTANEPCWSDSSVVTLRCRSASIVPLEGASIQVALQVADRLQDSVDADALHAAALVDLLSGDTARKTLQRSISYLEMTTRLAPRAPSALVDLAAAHLAYASSGGGARSLLVAANAASRALELDPVAPAALYDRALALDLLGLDVEATRAWREYLGTERESVYVAEARRRLANLSRDSANSVRPELVDEREVASKRQLVPEEARRQAWEQLLRSWGETMLSGDSSEARAHLSAARAIGTQLAKQYGEWSTANAVRAIDDASGDTSAMRRLAEAHVLYAKAQERAHTNEYRIVDSTLRSALAIRPRSVELIEWCRLGIANALIYERQQDTAARQIRTLLTSTDVDRRPLLRARLYWNDGVLLLRRGRTAPGLASIRHAKELFARVGYSDNVAAAEGLEGEASLQAGRTDEALTLVHHALLQLRASRTSVWRHNMLLVLSRAADRAGLPLAAMQVEDEDAAIAGVGLTAVSVTEARLARARSLWLAGQSTPARRAIEQARSALATVPAVDARAQLQAELELTTATTLVRSHPDSARRMLDAVVAFFAPLHYTGRTISALVARAATALALNNEAAAESDLSHAANLYGAAGKELADPTQRAALVTEARSVFDQLVMVRLRTGRSRAALEALENGRLSFASSDFAYGKHALAHGDGRIAIDYALIGDTLLTWVLRQHDTLLVRTDVDHEVLLNVIERLRVGLELGAAQQAVLPDLEDAYDLLLRQVAVQLPVSEETVTIVADGQLLDVPWAALRDRERSQYFVEQHASRLAPTLAQAEAPPSETAAVLAPLFVADPALDWRFFPELAPLPGAREEARALSGLYQDSELLDSHDADSAKVVEALRTAELFHFAGHAVFDDAQPERSYLALGPHGLNAALISHLDLRRLRLVVLSACETMRSSDKASAGFVGLADAFLSAGARGVVGSLWRVDDNATRQFMERFYRDYRASTNASTALRNAQVAMIRSGESPSAWAAFRYEGQ